MHKKGTIIQIQFDSTTAVVMLDKNGKVLYPSTVLKSKHKEIDVPKEAFEDFMDNFKSFENQKEGKKVLSPDFDKWLDKQIKDDKKKPKVDPIKQCPYDKNYKSSSSTVSSSTSSASSEEEDSVEEIKK